MPAGTGTIRYDTVRYGTIRYDTVRYGTVRYGTIRYGTLRYATVRYGTIGTVIRYDRYGYTVLLACNMPIFDGVRDRSGYLCM
jgi:hypothetical protein